MSAPGGRRFFNRNLLLLWQGQTISQLGSQAFDVALLLWLKEATESATLMGSMLMVSGIVAVLLGPFAGIVVDRHARRSVLVASDAILGVAMLGLALLMARASAAKDLIVAALFAVSVLSAAVGAFFTPAISALVPDVAPKERVSAANSLFQSTLQLCTFVGQGVGGTVFRLLGAPLLLVFNGVSYLFAAGCEVFIDVPPPPPAPGGTWRERLAAFRSDLAAGFGHVWGRSGLRTLVLASSTLNFFTVPVMLLMPFYVEDFLHAKADWYGFLLAAYGIGSLVGNLLAGALPVSGRTRAAVMIAVMILEGAGYVALGLVRTRGLAIGLAAAGGVAGGILMVYVMTLLQLTTPSEIRGRVFALLGTISAGLTPISMGLTGVVADLLHHDVPFLFMVCGASSSVIAALVSFNRGFRQYLAFEGPRELASPPERAELAPAEAMERPPAAAVAEGAAPRGEVSVRR